MKLFTKTLLFFITLIIFQAVLTLTIITNIVKKNDMEHAKAELANEAGMVYEGYNSWKRNIWKKLISLKHDATVVDAVRYYTASTRPFLVSALHSKFVRSGIDFIVVKEGKKAPEVVPLTLNTITLSDMKNLVNARPHPYIQIALLKSSLAMVGVVQLQKNDNTSVDLFLVKRIDKNFCDQLTLNRNSKATFFLDNDYELGPFDKPLDGSTLSFTQMSIAYEEFYDISINKSYYNIAGQKLENLGEADSHNATLYLVTFVSNEPYMKRLALIRKTALIVTFTATLLTILLSFFFSRNITNPIKKLLNAMLKVKEGTYDRTVHIKGRNEISRLFEGFNDMALKLNEDKKIMQNYIDEITFLNEYNEKIIHSIHAGIVIINRNLVIEKVNSHFLAFFSLHEEEVIDREITAFQLDIIDDEIISDVQSILNAHGKTYARIKRSGSKYVFELKLYPFYKTHETTSDIFGCVIVVEDISKKIEFEEKIFQAEKLSSISMLSAGVAHEINNPLSSIMTNVQNLMEDRDTDGEKIVALKWIEQETRRIAKIVRELLTFSSTSPRALIDTDVNTVIRQVINLITYSIKSEHRASIIQNLNSNLPRARINEDELKQVIINLINNSLQAIEERGDIHIKSSYRTKDRMIEIVVKDNGIGIPREITQKIFDPFFTTKKNGEGTGLGLSVVYGIVKKHNGSITISSMEQKGTTVKIAVPSV